MQIFSCVDSQFIRARAWSVIVAENCEGCMGLKQFNVDFVSTRDAKSALYDEMCGLPKIWVDSTPDACFYRLVVWCGEHDDNHRDGILRGQDGIDIERIARWRGKRLRLFKALTHPKIQRLVRTVDGWKIRDWEQQQPHLAVGREYYHERAKNAAAARWNRQDENATKHATEHANQHARRNAKPMLDPMLNPCSPTNLPVSVVGINDSTDQPVVDPSNPFHVLGEKVKRGRQGQLPGIAVVRDRPVSGGLVRSTENANDSAKRCWSALTRVLSHLGLPAGLTELQVQSIVVARQQLAKSVDPAPSDVLWPIANLIEATSRGPDKRPVGKLGEYILKCSGAPHDNFVKRADSMMKKEMAKISAEIERAKQAERSA